ncbi:MAG: hypothetical protein ABJ246_02775 [Paracoccaceae bacterium]
MDTERRALNDDERTEFSATALWKVDWKELVGFAAMGGGFLALFFLLAGGILLKLIGIDTNGFMGLSADSLPLFFVGIGASSFVAYVIWFEFRSQRNAVLRRQQILDRNDLIVEVYKVADCKLVREPEHGQCMYFVKSCEGKVIFVFEGQDELQEDWQEHPLAVLESERPRSELKIIRLPETNESVVVEFNGPEIPFHDCFEMTLAPNFWPASGKTLKSPWDDLQRRYRLKNFTTSAS